ncbi:hypothetical protein CDL12_26598 [Handroanthus impetiginosus]|uniref:J domain-containing protein n=1 Tax=Handroanthus impetiginosus TaxID=429701 RepID=A0A2G9G6H0_9LAMI|nr:hypothetical protein CDL12_26598 [Handroanthus impetiginosus]
MATTSFPLSNQIIGRKFSSTLRPQSASFRRSQRVSAAYATAEGASVIGSENTSQTASLYEVLGIPTGATCQEIKFAYRRLARVLHPDATAAGNASSADKFMRVHAA